MTDALHSACLPGRAQLRSKIAAFHLAMAWIWLTVLNGLALGEVAKDEASSKAKTDELKQAHWAFRPPMMPVEPAVKQGDWGLNPIDRFILARLEKEGLSPSPDADRATFLRRVSFDLTGLPPSPEEVAAFSADQSPNAYEKGVDRLLASHRYGQRWARHWLDIAGYADSNGYFDADTDRPLAWKYRDYVIQSFNEDKPFDRFVQEQLAGDELAGYNPDGDVTPEMAGLLIATHLLRNAPDGTGESDGNPQEVRADRYAVLEGNVQMLGSVFLGLTVQCARCHDHKFEPVTQGEYYQLQAILKPVYNHDQWLKPSERFVTIGSRADRERNQQEIEKHRTELKALKESFDGLLQPVRKLAVQENLAALNHALRDRILKALETKDKDRDAEMKALLKEYKSKVEIKDEDLFKRFPELTESFQSLKSLLETREKAAPHPLPQIAAVTEVTNAPSAHHLLKRGDYGSPGRPVTAGVPAVFMVSNAVYGVERPKSGAPGSGARLAFARWVVSSNHPTFARLMVNRVWQHHFGVGLAATSDNFGLTGARPTHPELLDYLAVDFRESGWQLKRLHRLIVLSRTYRQSSGLREIAYKIDPDNHSLWRYPVRRLDAESVRDAMLAASGELDDRLGGPYVPCERNEHGQVVVREKTPGSHRRSIYLQQRRTTPASGLEVFDFPQMNPNCSQRNSSTVTLQSLYLLNSDFLRERSGALARRICQEMTNSGKRLELAFALVRSRPPTVREREAAEEFLKAQEAVYDNGPDSTEKVWTDLSQMLMASSGFLYVE